jgi:hypothetical protein
LLVVFCETNLETATGKPMVIKMEVVTKIGNTRWNNPKPSSPITLTKIILSPNPRIRLNKPATVNIKASFISDCFFIISHSLHSSIIMYIIRKKLLFPLTFIILGKTKNRL